MHFWNVRIFPTIALKFVKVLDISDRLQKEKIRIADSVCVSSNDWENLSGSDIELGVSLFGILSKMAAIVGSTKLGLGIPLYPE